jgi:hypothetical protein
MNPALPTMTRTAPVAAWDSEGASASMRIAVKMATADFTTRNLANIDASRPCFIDRRGSYRNTEKAYFNNVTHAVPLEPPCSIRTADTHERGSQVPATRVCLAPHDAAEHRLAAMPLTLFSWAQRSNKLLEAALQAGQAEVFARNRAAFEPSAGIILPANRLSAGLPHHATPSRGEGSCSMTRHILLTVAAITVSAATVGTAPAYGQSSTAEITVLYDAFGTASTMKKDWGFSALIEYGGKRILFDTGNNAEIFAHNVAAKGIDLRQLDFAIMSHRHGC